MKKETSNIINEIAISENIINNIFSGKSESAITSTPLSDKEKKQMLEQSETVSKISGLKQLRIEDDQQGKKRSLTEQAIGITNCDPRVSPELAHKVKLVSQKMKRYESFLLRFVEKFK